MTILCRTDFTSVKGKKESGGSRDSLHGVLSSLEEILHNTVLAKLQETLAITAADFLAQGKKSGKGSGYARLVSML